MRKSDVQNYGAALIMEKLFRMGIYRQLKKFERYREMAKQEIKHRMPDEGKRMVFQKTGVVAKYQKYNIYEVDQQGLVECLLDLGIIGALTIDPKYIEKEYGEDGVSSVIEYLEPYKKPSSFYVRFYPNKNGKFQFNDVNFNGVDNHALTYYWRRMNEQYQKWENVVDRSKRLMKRCPHLKKETSMKCNYGTVKRMKKRDRYDMKRIFSEVGPDFLLEYARVDMALLQKFIEKGFISQDEVDAHRKIKDIRMKFIVLPLEAEQKQFELLNEKRMKQAGALQEMWKLA